MALETLIPDTPEPTETTQFATSKTPVSKSPYAITGGGTPTGVDPALLENMQKMIAEREAQKGSFLESLKDANAWWSGGQAGPGEALRARAKEREEAEATTFGMKSQIAQYKAQQALAQKTQQDVLGALGGGAPGTAPGQGGGFGTQIDPAIAKQVRDLAATDPAAARKLLQDHTKKMAEYTAQARMNPEAYKKTIEVRTATGKIDTVSLMDLLNNPQKYQPTEAGAAEARAQVGGPTLTGNAAEIAKSIGVPIISGDRDNAKQTEIMNESIAAGRPGRTASGNPIAKPGTSKHETGNAIDVDMKRATPEQIAALKAKGFTQPLPDKDPNHWELTAAPATNAVPAAPTFDQIKPMPKPIEAAPLAPPEIKDTFPVVAGEEKNAINLGAPAAAPAPAPVAAAPAPVAPAPRAPIANVAQKTMPELRAEQKASEEFQIQTAKGQAENIVKSEAEFRTSTEPKSVAERKTSAERVVSLVEQNPGAVGILAKPGIQNALMTIARDGLNTPSGAIGIKTIEDALIATMPGGGQQAINARKEIAQNLARGALEASKLSQGQGSVSDFERSMFEKIAGSLADTPELLIKRQKMLIARADLDKQIGSMYRANKTPGRATDFESFTASPAYVKAIDAYEEKLRGILGTDIVLNKQGPVAGKTPGGIQFKVITPAKPQ
jgi:LAS superfamily LD-carboxypeptidase LdcB